MSRLSKGAAAGVAALAALALALTGCGSSGPAVAFYEGMDPVEIPQGECCKGGWVVNDSPIFMDKAKRTHP